MNGSGEPVRQRRRCFVARAEQGDARQHKSANSLRMLCGQLHGYPSTEGVSEDDDRRCHVRENLEDELGILGGTPSAGGWCGRSETWQVGDESIQRIFTGRLEHSRKVPVAPAPAMKGKDGGWPKAHPFPNKKAVGQRTQHLNTKITS